MASTSPLGVRKPVSPWTTTSGRPPTALARTGTAHAIASSAARPNDSVSDGNRKRSLPRRISATSSTLPRKRTSRRSSRRSTSCSAVSRSGPSPTSTSVAGSWRRTPAKTRTTSVTRLTGRKFETWTRTLWPGGAAAGRVILGRRDEVGDDDDVAAGTPERAVGLLPQERRHGGDTVRLFDRELGERIVRWVLPDQGDVGAVQG